MKFITFLILLGLFISCNSFKTETSSDLKKSMLFQTIEMIRKDSKIYKLNNINNSKEEPIKLMLSDSIIAPSDMLSLSSIVKSVRVKKDVSQNDSIIKELTKNIDIEEQYKIDKSRYRDNRIQYDHLLSIFVDEVNPNAIIFIEEFSSNCIVGEVFGVHDKSGLMFNELAFYNNSLYFIVFFDEGKIIASKSGIKLYD